MTNSLQKKSKDDSLDIKEILKSIFNAKTIIFKVTVSFFIIGCIVALLKPVLYTSQTTFVPQVSDYQMSTSSLGLGSLASLTGINLNNNELSSDSYLSPLLYKYIIDSEEFSLNLLHEELIKSDGEKITIKEYLQSKESSFNFNLLGFLKKYTIGLLINDDTNASNSNIYKNYNFISDEEYYLLFHFRKYLQLNYMKKKGL